jgi:Ca2+-transporting ATPase
MGADCIFQGVVISVLTLISYFIGIAAEGVSVEQAVASDTAGIEGMTMAFLTLSMLEMFHSLNMRSRRASIFRLPTQNTWTWGAFGMSLLLTYIVIETPLSIVFGFAELDVSHYLIALGLAVLIIPVVELYKAVMRRVESVRS